MVAVTRPDLPGSGVERLAATDGIDVVTRDSHEMASPEELIALIARADAVLATGMDHFDGTVLRTRPGLRILATTSIGVDHIDLETAGHLGITVTNAPGSMDEACADFTFGLIVAARRRIVETDREIRRGAWQRNTMHEWLGAEVHHCRLGLVGFGAIAQAVARRATGFAMDIVHNDRSRSNSPISRWVELNELLAISDVVSLHVPLNGETRGLLNDRTLALMKRSATLVNTARGPVVDTDALVRSLSAGHLHSVALDVVEGEPIADAAHPLLQFENVTLAPHASSATTETRSSTVDRAVDNVLAVLCGQPPRDVVETTTDVSS